LLPLFTWAKAGADSKHASKAMDTRLGAKRFCRLRQNDVERFLIAQHFF